MIRKLFDVKENECGLEGEGKEILLAMGHREVTFSTLEMEYVDVLRCAFPTVGNLLSFSDNGYFSLQKLVQSTFISLKC